ncbi:MAG: family 78 glycoside hydrolase catalytic domain [Clostridia bacterium]|nr:family 78 glycoside hydrolase catalytic domain [Clostridia bacterium]
MTCTDIFGAAKWVAFAEDAVSVHARKAFTVGSDIKKAEIAIIGLGFFELYLNGKKVSDDLFLPLNTDFHARQLMREDGPFAEVTHHRVYATRYDVTGFVTGGKNCLGVMLGNGWYADDHQEKFGEKKLIFRLSLTCADGRTEEIVSDEAVKWRQGFVVKYRLTKGETHDYRGYDDRWAAADFDDAAWEAAHACDFPETEYGFSECPPDRVERVIHPAVIREEENARVYDIGLNTTGTPILKLTGGDGETVRVIFAEEKTEDNDVDADNCCWGQISEFISDGREREVRLRFTWSAGRYFKVIGGAEVLGFARIFADVKPSSSFTSSHETLNWLFNAFVNTQLSNMHAGIPSDCPHLERRGYTGDGELAADAAMFTLDARKFYDKWILDISDCQDRVSGHVQYTAPYTHSGGGPGGWGCAIIHVPFVYWQHYGDIGWMKRLYPQMLEYFRFLDDHSENGLIVSDVPHEWCLGDWCTAREIAIPAPFVNNYFYIRSIDEILTCAKALELPEQDVSELREKRHFLAGVLTREYYDASTGDFAGNIQGANAFAVDLGLGDERTFANLAAFYDALGMFDTGIFGTDILTRVLFANGRGDLAFRLLTSDGEFSFDRIRQAGSTTLWEYWTGRRSHSHPMFGAVVAYLFRYLLGVRLPSDGGTFYLEPVWPGCDAFFSGSAEVPGGTVRVSVVYEGDNARFTVETPCETELRFGGKSYPLKTGTNEITADRQA